MSEFNEGDLVEAVKGDTVVRGRVDRYGQNGLGIAFAASTLHNLSAEGFTVSVIEKAAPKLPTEPGLYIESNYPASTKAIWRLAESGKWLNAADPEFDNQAARFAPFTRLEPVPVTAKKVLERVSSFWEFGPPANISIELDDIAKEFGVTDV